MLETNKNMKLDKYKDTNIRTFDKDLTKMFSMYDQYIKDIITPHSRVLDIGPGNGGFSYYIYKKYNLKVENINFLDISTGVIEGLKSNINLQGANFILGDVIEFLSNNENKFDIIIMRHVLEHFEKKDINVIISLLEKNINKKGRIVLEVPNVANPLGNYMFFQDYSHFTPFTATSIQECITWNSNLSISVHNTFYNFTSFRTIKNILIFLIGFLVELLSAIFTLYTLVYKNKIYSPRLVAILKNK